MQQVDERPLETIHLYVVRENEEQKQHTMFPIVLSVICLLGIVGIGLFSANHIAYEDMTIRIPAVLLPLKQIRVEQVIVPTGIKAYPATQAHGTLTVYNGSILDERIPKEMIFSIGNGIEVITDETVFIPGGNPPYYGTAKISAHAVLSGKQGNITAFAINNNFGTSLFIRNLQAFTDGKNAYSVMVETAQDRQTAMNTARAFLTAQVVRRHAFLAKPCHESAQEKNAILSVSWQCQFVAYSVPPYMRITRIRLEGNNLLLYVRFVARPRIIQFK